MKISKKDQCTFIQDVICKDCGWPILLALCNDDMASIDPLGQFDYWEYCSNKCCKNHFGEGIFYGQGDAKFLMYDLKELV